MKLRHVELSGDVESGYMVEVACTDGRLLLAPDDFAGATIESSSHESLSPAEFEAVLASVRSPDGES